MYPKVILTPSMSKQPQDVYNQRAKTLGHDNDLTLRVQHNLGLALVANNNKAVSAYA